MSDRRLPLSLKLVNRWLSRAAQPGSDDELLRLYATRRDEAAFAHLVKRHGPMVLGVCRRLLGDHALAEDAFQATFLLLAQKAGTLKQPERLAGWLHGVAVKVASRARQRLRPATQLIETAARQELDAERREALRLLDEELAGLRDVERLPLVLCYLEGLTHLEAARRLGWPSGSFSWRLARAQAALRDRLVRRGVFLSAPALSVLLGSLAEAVVPETLEALAVRVASWVSLGQGPSLATQLAAETTVPASGSGLGLTAKMALAATVLLTSGLGWWWAAAGQGKPTPTAPGAVAAATPDLPPGASARLGSLAFRNQGPLGTQFISSRLTKDGQVLEGITATGAIQRWAFPTGRPLGILQPFREPLTSKPGWGGVFQNDRVAVRNGQEIVVGDLNSGRVLFRCPVNAPEVRPFEFCLCRRGEVLAVAAVQKKERADENAPLVTHTTLELYSVETGERVHSLRTEEEVYLLQVVEGGKNLIYGTRLFRNDSQLWHLDTGSFKRTELHAPEAANHSFAFDANSPRVLFRSFTSDGPDPKGRVFLWNWQTGRTQDIPTEKYDLRGYVPHLVGGDEIYFQTRDGEGVLWDAAKSKESLSFKMGLLYAQAEPSVSSAEYFVLRLPAAGFIVVDRRRQALVAGTEGNAAAVCQLLFTPDSKTLVSWSPLDLWSWPLSGPRTGANLLPTRPLPARVGVRSIGFLPNSSDLLHLTNEDDWSLFDPTTGKRTEAKQATREEKIAVHAMNRVLAGVDDGQGRYIEKHPSGFVWIDSTTDATIHFRLGDEKTRDWFTLALDPRGKWALFAKRETSAQAPPSYWNHRLIAASELLLFDLKRQTIRQRWPLPSPTTTGGSFSGDGQRLAILRGGQVQVLDTPNLQPTADFTVAEAITSLALNPTGETLATGMANGTVLLWPVRK